ncbi:DNA mismatch repair endonuclease MutL [Shewanella loihica]|uniref:DNA mismatch repair protein MutL n=1 Tax=Shewanella loihica (strain ATCC BAA-1088 / PV-4) TaxID=323850 RepID=MUTL_SHELP|nr:DNA mismatch repair endonuclease MutL [Shewanella loihica]A3QAD8.1 RecName: Full=DNA mismatch repair protein MutL [Shewanella loihica PV-4]ABO22436.1 DNA mismatch repair protein MutL [Shewanella loihica PV-4]
MTIRILPPQLANQIAAGEVVERPASVIKELVENSLDAGATRVDIEIDKGGSKLIKITDNGSGIPKEELSLALSRHATSKLASLDDLDAILSFGFRGEALASISSVSRLTLTSRTQEQSEAWQAYAEGSEMAVRVIPAAHPVGSTVEAADLFFNTPARRRFLKSDKTEFTHIDEWLKRIALVRSEIHFTLKHNGKQVRNYRPAKTEAQYLQRLAQVSGKAFADNALRVDCNHNGLSLSGYIQSPFSEMAVGDTQYFYVNGRLVRDRLVNHAVRQAFAQQLQGEQVAFVLMLNLDPHQVDVNVHPAKHEVRFHESRYVHDFILQALESALRQSSELAFEAALDTQVTDQNRSASYIRPLQTQQSDTGSNQIAHGDTEENALWLANERPAYGEREASRQAGGQRVQETQMSSYGSGQSGGRGRSYASTELPSQAAVDSYAQLMTTPGVSSQANQADDSHLPPMPQVLDGQYWLLVRGSELALLSLSCAAREVTRREIEAKLDAGLIGQPLLMPVSVKVDEDWQQTLVERELLVRKLGLELTIRLGQLIIKKVPPYLRQSQLASVIPEFLQWIRFEEPTTEALVNWLVNQSGEQFNSASRLWAGLMGLPESQQQEILSLAKVMPWQTWLGEQTSE